MLEKLSKYFLKYFETNTECYNQDPEKLKKKSPATHANLSLYVVIIEHIPVTTDADC